MVTLGVGGRGGMGLDTPVPRIRSSSCRSHPFTPAVFPSGSETSLFWLRLVANTPCLFAGLLLCVYSLDFVSFVLLFDGCCRLSNLLRTLRAFGGVVRGCAYLVRMPLALWVVVRLLHDVASFNFNLEWVL